MKTEQSMTIIIKVVLAGVFLICILDMPYGYYQLVRFLALVGFAIVANHANQEKDQTSTILYISLAVLFQPLIKIPLGREIWNIVDVFVAIGLIVSIFIHGKAGRAERGLSEKQ